MAYKLEGNTRLDSEQTGYCFGVDGSIHRTHRLMDFMWRSKEMAFNDGRAWSAAGIKWKSQEDEFHDCFFYLSTVIGILIGIALNLYNAFGSMVIVTILILPIQEQGSLVPHYCGECGAASHWGGEAGHSSTTWGV